MSDSFLAAYDAADDAGKAALTGQWLGTNPDGLFAELRQSRPNIVNKTGALVSRYPDVIEVLSRPEAFSVRLYAAKMDRATGGFFLGMDDTGAYQREISLMRLAARREDVPALQKLAATLAADAVGKASSPFEIVQNLTRLVPTQLAQKYFGVEGVDPVTMMNWSRAIFYDVFANLGSSPAIQDPADAASKALNEFLDHTIAEQKHRRHHSQDDLLGRLLQMQHDSDGPTDLEIRQNLFGLLVGAIETTSKAAVQALDQLFDRPNELAAAQKAALGGQDDLLASYIFEALRFNPQNPFLVRFCEEPYTVARETDRATEVPAGTLVFVGTSSAMMDQFYLQSPEEFMPDRPSYDTIHFGFGLHTCFGQYVNRVQIPAILKTLLVKPNLARASQIVYSGPFPDKFEVTW